MKKLDITKPLMMIEYLLEHESRELYKSDHAKKLGIKVEDKDGFYQYDSFYKHDYFPKKGQFDFCWATGTHISIEEMEKFIAKAKEKGATHLDIHHHADHDNYNLHALIFRRPTDNEVKALKKMAMKAKADAVKEIDSQIEKLQKEKTRLTK